MMRITSIPAKLITREVFGPPRLDGQRVDDMEISEIYRVNSSNFFNVISKICGFWVFHGFPSEFWSPFHAKIGVWIEPSSSRARSWWPAARTSYQHRRDLRWCPFLAQMDCGGIWWLMDLCHVSRGFLKISGSTWNRHPKEGEIRWTDPTLRKASKNQKIHWEVELLSNFNLQHTLL